MAPPVQIGPQLPPDSTGKVTAAFPVTITAASGASQVVYVPATVLVNTDGQEIGQQILDALRSQCEHLSRAVLALGLIAGEIAGVNPEELLLEQTT